MSCCTRIRPGKDQVNIVNKVNENQKKGQNTRISKNGASKSSRAPAGFIAKQCSNCGSKSISSICPVCQSVIE